MPQFTHDAHFRASQDGQPLAGLPPHAAIPAATILVVEDDENLLMGIQEILNLEGYHVQTADNGQIALQLLEASKSAPPDLIVSDIMMPVMDGLALLKEVRRHPEWVMIPFIFLTAKGERTDVHRGKSLGVDDYLVKPFEAADLLVAVDSRLNRHQSISKAQNAAISNIKKNLLAILNHEMRTPLTLVVAYADMLKGFSQEEMTPEDLLTFLHGVSSGAERLRRLIENFILLVEMEIGDVTKTYHWRSRKIFDLDAIIQQARDQVLIDELITHTTHIVCPQPIPIVHGDREYLIAMIRELIHNACKFSPADRPVTVRLHTRPDQVLIEITDQGRGIPGDQQDKIWDLFYQINRDELEDQGSGSGLAIARGLAQLHGGRIEVASQVGAGSTFTVILPIAAE
jgi:signal transduction histidine kinase